MPIFSKAGYQILTPGQKKFSRSAHPRTMLGKVPPPPSGLFHIKCKVRIATYLGQISFIEALYMMYYILENQGSDLFSQSCLADPNITISNSNKLKCSCTGKIVEF